MSLDIPANEWMQNPDFHKQKDLCTEYQCLSCHSEFSSPKVSTEEAKLILKDRRTLRETLLLMLLCVLISDYSFMLALAIATSIFFLKDIQRALIVSKYVRGLEHYFRNPEELMFDTD